MKKKVLSLPWQAYGSGTVRMRRRGRFCFRLQRRRGGRGQQRYQSGVILLGDDAESYTAAHIQGIEEAVSNLGLSEDKNIIWKYNVPEEQNAMRRLWTWWLPAVIW